MDDTLLFRGGSSADIAVSTVQNRELVIDTDTDQIVSGASKKKTVMEDSSGDVTVTGTLTASATGDSDNQVFLDSRGAILAFRETTASTWSSLSAASSVVPSGGYQILSGGNYNAGTRVTTAWINSNGSAYFQGTVGIGGTLPSSPNIELSSSGSADFAGVVSSGPISVGTASSTALGVQLSSGGLIRVQRPSTASASTPVFSGFNGNTENITLTSGGSAVFGGLVRTPNLQVSTNSDTDGQVAASLYGATGGAVRGLDIKLGTSGTSTNALVTFDAKQSSNGALAFATTGVERLRIDQSGDVLIGGTSPSSPNISLRTDGSAKYESAIDLTPDNTGVVELRSSDATMQAGSADSNLMRLVANTTQGYTAALISLGKYEDSSFGRGELTLKVANTSLSASLAQFKFRGDGKALLPGDVLIGGTLPSSPNISLNATGAATFTGITQSGATSLASTTNSGVNLNPSGQLVVQRTAGSGSNALLWRGYSGNTQTSSITSGGSATFAGDLEINKNPGSGEVGALINLGEVSGETLTTISSTRVDASYKADLEFKTHGNAVGTLTTALKLNSAQNAEFAGDVTCTNNSKGLVLKSPNGTSFRLSVADDGTLSATSI